jgi:NAD(P)-dependent dehydrogenase (short-subunit alcohol dehydrogenase family)
LSKPEDRERLFADMVERAGAPDILVNNAAVTFLRPLDEFPERRMRLMLEMHVLAPMHLAQLAIPAMRERGRGWVLNVTSVGGDLPEGPPFSEFDRTAGFGVYGTVKAALNRLTKSLAAELYDDGIAVNAAAPSNPVATPGAHTRPGEDRHRGHRAHHPDRADAVHRRPEVAYRPDRAHAAVFARDRMAALSDPLLVQLAERLTSRDVSALEPLQGGASSLTYLGRCADRPVVVNVARPGARPIAHRDVLRQARVIRALAATSVPVPEVLFDDPGDPPDVPPLFVMSQVDGSTSEPLFDDADCGPETVVAERFRNATAAMARLHRIESGAVGLGSEPVIGPTAEVERWCRTLETVDPALVPGWRGVAADLESNTPPALPAAVVHGDFRLGNLLAVDDRITAVIDREIWSVGDPRVDAGWFLINCDPRTYRRSTRYVDATPPLSELAAVYREELGRKVPELDWFCALACFKSAATWSLIIKHNRRRKHADPGLEAMASALPQLLSAPASCSASPAECRRACRQTWLRRPRVAVVSARTERCRAPACGL